MSPGPVSAVAAATDFAHALVAAALNRQLHPADSRFVQDSLQELVDELRGAARAGVPMPLTLDFDYLITTGERDLAWCEQQVEALRKRGG